ncbi:MAG: DUF6794 domain-containing protein [Saprospiraceae bacterium]|nr:DUF6794 domain-containing protein [Saprospiraceae bacterium]
MNEKRFFILAFCLIARTLSVFAQVETTAPPATKSEFEQIYAQRVVQSKLDGQYIPKDIFDAFNQLHRLTDTASRLKFKSMTEYEVEHKVFFSLGRWIATKWSLYDGSRYSQYLREAGVSFPEDQAIATMICWHRKLNGKDIDFKEIKDKLIKKRKKEEEERQKKMKVIKETVVKPTQKN